MKKVFYLSGFLSFFVYLILLLLFTFYILPSKTKTYSFKDDSIEIELSFTKDEKVSKIVKIETKKEEKIEDKEKIVEASISNKKADVKSLFANVKDDSKKLTDEEINNIKKSIDPKRFKSKFEKEKREDISMDRIFEKSKTTTSLSSENKNSEDDEYLKSVNSLLSKWLPIIESQELSSTVSITIDSLGNFTYRVIKKTGNINFDESLEVFLEKQISIKYPSPKKGTIRLEVEFKQKDRDD